MKEKETEGILYGIGVGPGDPELMTIKALRLLKECDVIAVPAKEKEKCTAYQIARQAEPSIEKKEWIGIFMPMVKDKRILEEAHQEAAKKLAGLLEQGKQVAFLVLGDPAVYSTYAYVHKILKDKNYKAELVSGVPSFCAAAARVNEVLAEGGEQLHIIPASYEIEKALALDGTKVLMKSGKEVQRVAEILKKNKRSAAAVTNCGMEGEKVFYNMKDIREELGYYTLFLVKDK